MTSGGNNNSNAVSPQQDADNAERDEKYDGESDSDHFLQFNEFRMSMSKMRINDWAKVRDLAGDRFKHGMGLFIGRKVEDSAVHFDDNTNIVTITAKVRGGNLYNVEWKLLSSGEVNSHGCTCKDYAHHWYSHQRVCKHLCAVLLNAVTDYRQY